MDLEPYYPKSIEGFVIDSIITADGKYMFRYSYTDDGLIKSTDDYSRESVSDNFEFLHQEKRTYDKSGNLTELSRPGFTLTRNYDNQGNCIMEKREELNYSVHFKLIERIFNNQNKPLSEIISYSYSDTLEKSTGTFYGYDENGNMLECIYARWIDSGFVNTWREVYTFDSLNRKKTWRQQNWNDTAWIPGGYWDVYYYNSNNSLFEVVSVGLGPKLFGPLFKKTYEYDERGNNIKISSLSKVDTGWVLKSFDTSSYDNKNRLTYIAEVSVYRDSSRIDNAKLIFYHDSISTVEKINKLNKNGTLQIISSTILHYNSKNNFDHFFNRGFDNDTLTVMDSLKFCYDADDNIQTVLFSEWEIYDKTWRRLDYHDINLSSKIIDNKNNIFGFPDYYDGYENDYFEFNGIRIFWKRLATDVDNKVPLADISVFPNPSSDIFTIKYEVEKPSNVRYVVSDYYGNILFSTNLGMIDTGEHTLDYQPENLASGIYFFRIISDNSIKTGKLIYLQ